MIIVETLPNGLTPIVEPLQHVESVAYELQIPGGVLLDREGGIGSSLVLAELTCRGAGGLDSRALSDAFDDRGIRHGESAGHDRMVYRGLMLGEHFESALRLTAKMVLAPELPEDEIPNIQSIMLQDIASLPDDPARHAMVELCQRFYPAPYGRPSHGLADDIKALEVGYLQSEWERLYRPRGSVLAVAGNVEVSEVRSVVSEILGSWEGTAVERPKFGTMPAPINHHMPSESAQLQVVLAYPSAKFRDPHYYAAKLATGVLSGGMFGRLFIEVREKRGLCYTVFARHSATLDYGTLLAYAGTTPERAHETLDVMLQELRSLRGTITAEELERARANLLAALVIGEESTSARASSSAGDWWVSGTVRTLDEIEEAIHKVTLAQIDEYLERFPAEGISLLTLGSRELSI